MAKYKLHENDSVFDNDTGAVIPNNPLNKQWQQYLRWLAEGNTPDPRYTQEELDEIAAREATEAERLADFIDAIPSNTQVQAFLDNIKSNAAAATILEEFKQAIAPLIDFHKKHALVTNWLIHGKKE